MLDEWDVDGSVESRPEDEAENADHSDVPGLSRRLAPYLTEADREAYLNSAEPECVRWMDLLGVGIQRMAEHHEAKRKADAARLDALAATREAIRIYRESLKRSHERNKERAWALEKEWQRRRREKKKLLPPDPMCLIDKEFEERLGKLQRATAARRRDKRLEQVRGRERHYSLIWKATALAALKHGPKPSAARTAEEAQVLLADPTFTRHKARSAIAVVAALEEPTQPWALHRA